MKTGNRWLNLLLLGTLLAACGDSAGDDDSTGDQPDAAPAGHAITVEASLVAKDGKFVFMTPQASLHEIARADLVGKTYLVGIFPGGFSPGNDPALEQQWGVLGDDLKVTYTSTRTYPDGPYDLVFAVWTETEITEAMKNGTETVPFPELGSFTLSTAAVKPGDPEAGGNVRVNVEGADVMQTLTNRTPDDLMNTEQITKAFNETILYLP